MPAFILEKETLRNLTGPDVRIQTGLKPLATPQLKRIHGGDMISSMFSSFVTLPSDSGFPTSFSTEPFTSDLSLPSGQGSGGGGGTTGPTSRHTIEY